MEGLEPHVLELRVTRSSSISHCHTHIVAYIAMHILHILSQLHCDVALSPIQSPFHTLIVAYCHTTFVAYTVIPIVIYNSRLYCDTIVAYNSSL